MSSLVTKGFWIRFSKRVIHWSGIWIAFKIVMILVAYPYYVMHKEWPAWFMFLHELIKKALE